MFDLIIRVIFTYIQDPMTNKTYDILVFKYNKNNNNYQGRK